MALPRPAADSLERALDVDNGRFRVQVEGVDVGDIAIGAVEIKDGATDTRAKVKTDGTDNALVVVQNAPPTGSATAANQDTEIASLASIDGKLTTLPGLSIPVHDYIGLTYTGDNPTTIVYKTGGSGGTTVATLTLTYTGANVTSVTKS